MMKQGKFWLLVVLATLIGMVVYFSVNPSYERSIEARIYYSMNEYKEANRLAAEAFALDPYNRMASTVMAQSKTAMQIQAYIEEANRYLDEIAAIARSESITAAQKARMHMMCQIMIDSYVKIAPIKRDGRSVVIDRSLIDEARKLHDQFVTLNEKLAAEL